MEEDFASPNRVYSHTLFFSPFFAQDNVLCKFVQPADINLLHRAGVGLAAGGIASFMCCPIEVTCVL